MRRRVIAAVWIAGATVPLLLATVFVFGCCVLPFHNVAHKLMPVCHVAAGLMRGDEASHDRESVPPREKQEPAKRFATTMPTMQRLVLTMTAAQRAEALAPPAGSRRFLSFGAMRCDRDVGLHLLDETFRI